MTHGLLFIGIACVLGLLMTWGVGANDLANVMSTTIGSKAITARQAIIIAIVFEFAGALLGGIHVSNTIRSGIINLHLFIHTPYILIYGMLASLLASMLWIGFASFVGMPVSITNTIVGAIVGFGAIVLGFHAIYWSKIILIGVSWIFSPVLAGFVAFLIFTIIKRLILSSANPFESAKFYLPGFFFFTGIMLAVMVVLRDLSSFGYHFKPWINILITIGVAILITIFGLFLSRRIDVANNARKRHQFEYVEKLFSVLMVFTACGMVFAHGSNDVAISVGPIAAVISIVKHNGYSVAEYPFPFWTMALGCVGVVFGLFTYGHKIIETVGKKITALTPSRAFAATLAAAGTVLLSTSAGIPVSATQTLVGGVFGVGLARGIGAIRLNVVRNIILSWVITVPAAAFLSIACFDLLKLIFS